MTSSSTLKIQRPARPVLAVALIIGSLYGGLSLASYDSQDPSWSFSTSHLESIKNWGGVVGSWTSDLMLQILGIVSYLLIGFIFLRGVSYLDAQSVLVSESTKKATSRWNLITGISLLILSLCGLLALLPLKLYKAIALGGLLGTLVAESFVLAFSLTGATLILLGLLWASLMMTGIRIPAVHWLQPLKLKLHGFWTSLSNFHRHLIFWKKSSNTQEPRVHHERAPLKNRITDRFSALFRKHESPRRTQTQTSSLAPTDKPVKPLETKPEASELLEAPAPKQVSLFQAFSARASETPESDGRILLKDRAPVRKKLNPASSFELPSLQLLDLPIEQGIEVSKEELIANSKTLEQKLLDFGIQGQVTNIRPGPIITLYEFEPAPGVKVKNILNLTDDLKLAMKSVSIRILAPIPGRAAVGIEIPNPRRQTVYLRELLQATLFQTSSSPLTMAMGKSTSGEAYVTDLAKMPHLLIAGATGSGKSVGVNAMIVSMLYKAGPEDLKFIMIDPKMLELSVYDGIPHLLLPVVTDAKKAARALAWAVKEMERRYKLISSLGSRNLKSYNEKVARLSEDELKKELERTAATQATTDSIIQESELSSDEESERTELQTLALQEAGLTNYVQLPHIVIVIDELADLIMVAARDVEESIARLAQMARAAGIHLIIATQRPSVDVITGVIKANLPTRCAFQVASKVDSRTIIDSSGAENLIGEGDMLFLPPGTSRLERLHGPFISEDEIARVVRHLKTQAAPDYSSTIDLEESASANDDVSDDDIDDELYDQALSVVFETKSPSASMIQRRLRVGYNRAARLIERMEREGIVSAPSASGKGRELLVTPSYE